MQKKTIQRLAAAGVLSVAVAATLVYVGTRDPGESLTYNELEMEMSRNVQSGNTQNLKSMVIQRSFPKWSVAERRKTAAASDQAAVCACAHSRYFAGGSPSGLRV